jgi:hypothetical protein
MDNFTWLNSMSAVKSYSIMYLQVVSDTKYNI